MNRQRLKRRRLNSGEEFDEKFATGKKRWTDDDVALLTRLRDASTPWSCVARQLGRTIEACKSRIWRQSTEYLRDDTPVVKLENLNWPDQRPHRRMKLEKEESGRLARPTPSKPFYRQPSYETLTPPQIPFKRKRDEDDFVEYNVTDKYPTSPRLDDDDDDDSPRNGTQQWFAEPEIKKEPYWHGMSPVRTENVSFESSIHSIPDRSFFDFLKDDSSSDSNESSKTSLFEIPSSSLNVEVKEEEKPINPWSVFYSHPYLPRFNSHVATQVNGREEWWLNSSD
jgi:hypothetical protein